jgi:hypothetical protein
MRRGNQNCWLEQDGKVFGVNLGSDFTSEHEWGIKELNERLGVESEAPKKNFLGNLLGKNEERLGIEKRRIRKPNMDNVVWVEDGDEAVLMVIDQWLVKRMLGKKVGEFDGELKFYRDETMATAWSGNDLGVHVRGKENVEHLRRIYNAIQNKEAAIWLGGGGVFKNAGLCIAIINEVPEASKQLMRDADVDRKNLDAASEKTGIKERIDKINSDFLEKAREKGYGLMATLNRPLGYYALSPSWISEDRKEQSKHPVIYWLNPMQQDRVNFGWFTVEQLEEWIEGKGPIPMTEEQINKKKRA